MDSTVLNTELIPCGSVPTQALKASRKLPNLDLQCYLDDKPERKINLYTKHAVSPVRSQRKVSKRTLPLVSPTIEDRFVETSPRAEVEGAKDDLESGLNSEYLDTEEMPRKCLTPVPGAFIRDMVEQFDNQSQSFNGVQVKTSDSMSQESFKTVTKKCTDSLQSTENDSLTFCRDSQKNISQRARSQSENVGNTEKRVHHSRSTKPTTAPKPTFCLKNKLHVADFKSESLGSALFKSKADEHCCTEVASPCASENADNSTTNATSLTNSISMSIHDDAKQIPAGNRISGCDVQTLCNSVTDVDISSDSKHLGEL